MDTIYQEVKKQPSKKDRLDALKAEFNEVQEKQRDLLYDIFKQVKDGQGYRRIEFEGEAWSNTWDQLAKADKRRVDDLLPLITDIAIGH